MRAYLTEFERDYAAFNDNLPGLFPRGPAAGAHDRRREPLWPSVRWSRSIVSRAVPGPGRGRAGMASHVAKHTAFAHGVAGAAGGAGFGRARRGGLHAAIGARTRSVPWTAITRLPSGRAAELCDILPETQPFTSATWLVVRMVVPELPETGSESAHNDHDWVCGRNRFAGGGSAACAHRRATDGGALHQGRTRTGDNPIHRGLHDPGWCLHLGAFVMPIQYFCGSFFKRCQV